MVFDPSSDSGWDHRLRNQPDANPQSYILANPGDVIVAEQLHCHAKAAQKFPSWHHDELSYTRLALEQSSGEEAAKFKADFIHNLASGSKIADLTGGLGMDTFAFSHKFAEVHYFEKHPQPYLLAKYNHQKLANSSTGKIFHTLSSAEDGLQNLPHCDWIYLDPSRRMDSGRVINLKDYEPDVFSLWQKLIEKSDNILMKISPMYDIDRLFSEIPDINQVVVVSVRGEVKELLAISTSAYRKELKNTDADKHEKSLQFTPDKLITAVCLPEITRFSATFNEVKSAQKVLSEPMKFLHVPDAAVVKARLTFELAKKHDFKFLSRNSGYLTSEKGHGVTGKNEGFNTYEIYEVLPYKPKDLKKRFQNSGVNIHKRDFPISPPEIYKRLGLRMGDDYHLFFTTLGSKDLSVIVTRQTGINRA